VISPKEGVVKLYAPQSGQLQQLMVKEGDAVRRGQVLMVFETARETASGAPVEGQIDLKESPKHDAEGQRREEDGRSKPKPHALPEWVHGTQSARKTLNSPRVAAWRSDTHTSFLPSDENIGKLLK